jgi:hypothetical protein
MMAVVASFTNNQLSIIGDSAADTVVVSTVDVGGVAQVTVNGQGVGSGVDASAVASIFANLGGGNDTMNLSTLDLTKFSGLTDGSIEIRGGAGNDTLVGSPLGDILKGEDGNDSLTGGAGNDQLNGGNGNDTLVGGAGDDILDGGAGDDMYSFSGSTDLGSDTVIQVASGNLDTLGFGSLGGAIVVDISMTTPQVVRAGLLTLTLSDAAGIDNVQGTAYDDVILGNAGGNSLMGNGGNDYLWGRGGNDWLDGGSGNDSLYGGDGNDTLLGKGGNDSLYGHAGNDTLNGNEGNDYLSGDEGDDTYIVANYGTKTIAEALGEGSDDIRLSGQALSTGLDLNSTSVQTVAPSLSVRFTNSGGVDWQPGAGDPNSTPSELFKDGYYTVPGVLGATTIVEFKFGGQDAFYSNTFYVYDATKPTNRYAARPVTQPLDPYMFKGHVTDPGTTIQLPFAAGAELGFFIEQNADRDHLFFADKLRNTQDLSSLPRAHVKALDLLPGVVQLTWEDLYYEKLNPYGFIQDEDFNDLYMSVQAVYQAVDLDTDSDNNQQDGVERTKDEEDIEDGENSGKRIFVNTDDDNKNGIPDFEDDQTAYADLSDNDFAMIKLVKPSVAKGDNLRLVVPNGLNLWADKSKSPVALPGGATPTEVAGGKAYDWPLSPSGFTEMPDLLFIEGAAENADGHPYVVRLEHRKAGGVLDFDKINISVEKIVYPFKGLDAEWSKQATTTWKGVDVASGWGISKSLVDYIMNDLDLGVLETRRPDLPGKVASGAVFGQPEVPGLGQLADSYITANLAFDSGFTLEFSFSYAKDHGDDDSTGYVQADGKGEKGSFVGNSGIKFGKDVLAKDVEVAILDVPSMLAYVDTDPRTFSFSKSAAGEWGLSFSTSDDPPGTVTEPVSKLLNGVRYGGGLQYFQDGLTEGVEGPLGEGDDVDVQNDLYTLYVNSTNLSAGAMKIEVKPGVIGTFSLNVWVEGEHTYSEANIAMEIMRPRFQSHWGSGVVFSDVVYASL